MGRIYGLRILAGKMTLDQVPELWKKITSDWLKNEERT